MGNCGVRNEYAGRRQTPWGGTRTLVATGLMIGLGVLLPMVFHAVNLGKVFLPMHIPVYLAGLYLGPVSGLLVGLITPSLSGVLTGMPAFMPPVAQAMTVELSTYGVVSGLFRRYTRTRATTALVISMISGRLVYALVWHLAMPLFGVKQVPVATLLGTSVITGLPGIILQIIIVPLMEGLFRRAGYGYESGPASGDLGLAAAVLNRGHSVVVVKGGRVLTTKDGSGVTPFLEAACSLGRDMEGAALADRVVGVAVAKLAVYFGVREVYCRVASEPAGDELSRAGIPLTYDRLVPHIMNREGTDLCPIERLASGAISPAEVYARLSGIPASKPAGA
ncbi:MAG: DUF1893 domain-containing protein [Firmicutes bacterium]|nr:DUF1893 domain-containing protein [Bacillota bacterium]